eukprot:jgi/Ulvmu1/9939/UM058_0022.1
MYGLVVLVLCAAISVVPIAQAQGFGRKKEIVPAIKDDIKYIQCQFCGIAAKRLHRSVGDLRRDAPSWKKISEDDILEHLEAACNADKVEGEWILHLDVQEQGDELVIKEMSKPGKCQRECQTMVRMCEDIVGDHDTDLAEVLLRNPGRATVEQELCHDFSSACVKKPPKFSGPRPDGEDFEEVDQEALQMQRMMSVMQEQGMSGNLFDREAAMEQMNEYQEEMEDQGVPAEQMAGMMGGGEL